MTVRRSLFTRGACMSIHRQCPWPCPGRRHQRGRPRPRLWPAVLGAAAQAVWAWELAVPAHRQPDAVPPPGAVQQPGQGRRQQVGLGGGWCVSSGAEAGHRTGVLRLWLRIVARNRHAAPHDDSPWILRCFSWPAPPCRQRLYEAACDTLEGALHSPLPNRVPPSAAA